MWNIFEQPWTLLVIAAILALVVAIIQTFKSNRLFFLIPLTVALLAPALDFAVRTDRAGGGDHRHLQGARNAEFALELLLVRRRLDPEAGKRRQVLVKGTVVPEVRLAAADAAMSGLDRKADAVVPALRSGCRI